MPASSLNIKTASAIFFLGILGTGMRSLAYLLEGQGKRITGSDQKAGSETGEPGWLVVREEEGEKLLRSSDLLIYSDAVPYQHPLRSLARTLGIPELGYHEALGQFSLGFTTIAIAGTHGKSSTTAMLGHILAERGLDPTVLVGAIVQAWKRGARRGRSKFLIAEADEYREHFHTLRPQYVIITTLEHDHPDFFPTFSAAKKSFATFLSRIPREGTAVTSADLYQRHADLPWPQQTVRVSRKNWERLSLPLPGEHMRHNAALAIAMAEILGVARADAEQALQTFQGLGRRLERLGAINACQVFSDYGHHPTEITATLAAVREKYPQKRVLVIFEAHTLERLQTFFPMFTDALRQADGVLLTPIFLPSGREKETAEGEAIMQKLATALEKTTSVQRAATVKDIFPALQEVSRRFDIAVAFSAGILDSALRRRLS